MKILFAESLALTGPFICFYCSLYSVRPLHVFPPDIQVILTYECRSIGAARMYRSLSDRGSFTHYEYVLPGSTADAKVILNPTSSHPHFSLFFPRLGHRIRPSSRRGRRTPLRLLEDPMLCNFLRSQSQRAVGQYAKPPCSFQRTKYLRILYRTDRSLALHTRTRKTRRTRLDMGWFSPVWVKRCDSISHLFALSSQCTSTPRSRTEQPDRLVLYCLPFSLSTRRDPRSDFRWSL